MSATPTPKRHEVAVSGSELRFKTQPAFPPAPPTIGGDWGDLPDDLLALVLYALRLKERGHTGEVEIRISMHRGQFTRVLKGEFSTP